MVAVEPSAGDDLAASLGVCPGGPVGCRVVAVRVGQLRRGARGPHHPPLAQSAASGCARWRGSVGGSWCSTSTRASTTDSGSSRITCRRCNALSRASRCSTTREVAREIGATRTEIVPIPSDCVDGFNWAYWNRPDGYLDPEARACMSGLALLEDEMVAARMEMLRADLADGTWHRKARSSPRPRLRRRRAPACHPRLGVSAGPDDPVTRFPDRIRRHLLVSTCIDDLAGRLRRDRRCCSGASCIAGPGLHPGGWTKWVARLIGVVLLADLVSYIAVQTADGTWYAKTSLPLPLCDVGVLVAAVACLWNVPLFVELTYFWGIAGTLQAVAFPDLSTHVSPPRLVPVHRRSPRDRLRGAVPGRRHAV